MAPLGCRKPEPSEDYAEAHTRFSKLYAKQGDAAFGDAAMDEVEALLARVPANSLDAAAAQELGARIQAGRARIRSEAQARQAAVAQARMSNVMPGSFAASETRSKPAEETPEESAEEAPEEGERPAVLGVGTPEAELAKGFSGCFQKGEPVEVRNRGIRERWELADRATCRQQYASLVDQVLLIEEGKVLALVAKNSLQTVPQAGGSR
jgi:hypothetical protein